MLPQNWISIIDIIRINRLLPKAFDNLLTHNSKIHTHGTRQSQHLHLPFKKTNLGQTSISFKGSKLWNSLHNDYKQTFSINCFKNYIKKSFWHLIQKFTMHFPILLFLFILLSPCVPILQLLQIYYFILFSFYFYFILFYFHFISFHLLFCIIIIVINYIHIYLDYIHICKEKCLD